MEMQVKYFFIKVGLAFVGISTILWLNLNPYYLKKIKSQDKVL